MEAINGSLIRYTKTRPGRYSIKFNGVAVGLVIKNERGQWEGYDADGLRRVVAPVRRVAAVRLAELASAEPHKLQCSHGHSWNAFQLFTTRTGVKFLYSGNCCPSCGNDVVRNELVG